MKFNDFFVRLDLVIQTLIVIPTLTSLLFVAIVPGSFFIYMLGLLFLGGWQLLSALSHFLFGGNQFRGWYFLASVTYLGLLFGGTYLIEELNIYGATIVVLAIAFFGIIPSIAGAWYYRLTVAGDEFYGRGYKLNQV